MGTAAGPPDPGAPRRVGESYDWIPAFAGMTMPGIPAFAGMAMARDDPRHGHFNATILS